MDYERINQVQTTVISPGKLRLKLLGANYARRKDEGNSSSKTSPRKSEDMKLANSSLLMVDTDIVAEGDLWEPDDSSATCFFMPKTAKEPVPCGEGEQSSSHPKETSSKSKREFRAKKFHNTSKGIHHQAQPSNSSTVHPVRTIEEDGNELDGGKHSRDSSSNFEFHKGDRTLYSSVTGHISRPLPSKWNDAEKWIMSRPATCNTLRRSAVHAVHGQAKRQGLVGWTRVALESAIPEKIATTLSHEFVAENVGSAPPSMNMVENFSFDPEATNRTCELDLAPKVDNFSILPNGRRNEAVFPIAEGPLANGTGVSSRMPVCMKDMGTEMTPIPSQEPSRMGTPIGATTPIRSCNSSSSSTPRGAPMPSPVKSAANNSTIALSDEEFQLKTRREIIALGIKLGKTNIAAWARSDMEKSSPSQTLEDTDQPKNLEFEARSAAWEEAEKSKYMASFRREVTKIKLWESNQIAKFQNELREVEVQVEKMRAQAQEKIMKKLATVKQQSEAKLAAAEAQKKRQAARTFKQAANISKLGHMPSWYLLCCSW